MDLHNKRADKTKTVSLINIGTMSKSILHTHEFTIKNAIFRRFSFLSEFGEFLI